MLTTEPITPEKNEQCRRTQKTKINLNRAGAEELDRIFGVGPATAQRIIDYREDELGGSFHSVHDITHINGLADKTAQMIMEKSALE